MKSQVPKRRLDRAMLQAAWNSLGDADVIALLVDAAKADDKMDAILDELRRRGQRVVLALNKIDGMRRDTLLALSQKLFESGVYSEVYMISAANGDGVEDLKQRLGRLYGPRRVVEEELGHMEVEIEALLVRFVHRRLRRKALVLQESGDRKEDWDRDERVPGEALHVKLDGPRVREAQREDDEGIREDLQRQSKAAQRVAVTEQEPKEDAEAPD